MTHQLFALLLKPIQTPDVQETKEQEHLHKNMSPLLTDVVIGMVFGDDFTPKTQQQRLHRQQHQPHLFILSEAVHTLQAQLMLPLVIPPQC